MELRYTLAVVTGAGAGLGRELAVALSRRGASVLVADRDPEAGAQTAELVREARVKAWSFQGDLADEVDVRLLAARARDLGGADVLVNNAGSWSEREQYPDAGAAEWGRTLDLDLRTPMLLTQLFLQTLPERRGPRRPVGAVVNVASSAALGSDPYGSPEYAAAKAGLIRFTTAMGGHEDARVMAVVPGWIGLPRAQEQWAGLTADEQAAKGPLVATDAVTRAVVELLEKGRAGEVRELLD